MGTNNVRRQVVGAVVESQQVSPIAKGVLSAATELDVTRSAMGQAIRGIGRKFPRPYAKYYRKADRIPGGGAGRADRLQHVGRAVDLL